MFDKQNHLCNYLHDTMPLNIQQSFGGTVYQHQETRILISDPEKHDDSSKIQGMQKILLSLLRAAASSEMHLIIDCRSPAIHSI